MIFFSLKRLYLVLWSVLLLVSACGKGKPDTKQIAQEIEDRKIKRVTEADLTEAGYNKGEEVLKKADSLWKALPEAEKIFYGNNFFEFENNLSKINGAEPVKIINFKTLPKGLSEEQRSVAEAYAYNSEQQLSLEKNVYIKEGDVVFTAPFPTISKGESPLILYAVFSKKYLIRNMKTP